MQRTTDRPAAPSSNACRAYAATRPRGRVPDGRGAAGWLASAVVLAGGGLLTAGAQASPLAGGAYDIVEAELVDRRSGTIDLWYDHIHTSDADEIRTSGALTTRGTGDWQTTLGFGTDGTEPGAGESDTRAFLNAEGMWLLRDPHRDGYGLGLAGGVHYDVTEERRGEHYLVAPWSAPWGQRTTVHANAGVLYDHQADDTEGIWGAGLDWRFTESWDVILQVTGDTDSDQDPRAAVGIQRGMLDDLVELDLAYGRVMDSGEDDEYYFGVSIDAIRF